VQHHDRGRNPVGIRGRPQRRREKALIDCLTDVVQIVSAQTRNENRGMITLLSALLICLSTTPFVAAEERVNGGPTLTVRRSATKEIVWRRRVQETNPYWSPSGRSLVSLDSDWTLLLWRDGQRVRRLRLRPFFSDGAGELPGFPPVWAPDERHVLFRVPGSQGSQSIDLGTLVCLNWQTGRTIAISDSADSPRWLDNSTVAFNDVTPQEIPTPWTVEPRTWSVIRSARRRH
jgi:hypothetical protein